MGEDLSDVVAAATKHCKKGVVDDAFQGATRKASIRFDVSSLRLDGAAASAVADYLGCKARACAADLHAGFVDGMATITTVDDSQVGPVIGQDLHLFERGAKRLTIVRIAGKAAHADDKALRATAVGSPGDQSPKEKNPAYSRSNSSPAITEGSFTNSWWGWLCRSAVDAEGYLVLTGASGASSARPNLQDFCENYMKPGRLSRAKLPLYRITSVT